LKKEIKKSLKQLTSSDIDVFTGIFYTLPVRVTQYAQIKSRSCRCKQETIIYLFYFAQKNVLFVEEENTAGLVEKVVVHNLLEQVNALSQPNTVHFSIFYINKA
jgi:hypothetical protein